MKLLPARTDPPETPHQRRHDPARSRRDRGYRRYRPCLRWDFGFTCAFCLIHERDIVRLGVEGWGVTGVEHFVPRSRDPALENAYTNCYYICARCNAARSDRALETQDGRLLDPCTDVWAEAFEHRGHSLRPRPEAGRDAQRTWEAYDLGDPVKEACRRMRATALGPALAQVRLIPGLLRRLVERWRRSRDPALLQEARVLEVTLRHAVWVLFTLRPVPDDAPETCRCSREGSRALPEWLREQCQDVEPAF